MRISLLEVMIVVTAMALASSRIAMSDQANPLIAALAAFSVGPTIAGVPLLLWRQRKRTLTGKWGVGEITWFTLGIYFLTLMFFSLLSGAGVEGDRWLIVALATGATASVAVLVISFVRWLLPTRRRDDPNRRNWLVRRWTNMFGLAILGANACGAVVAWLFWR